LTRLFSVAEFWDVPLMESNERYDGDGNFALDSLPHWLALSSYEKFVRRRAASHIPLPVTAEFQEDQTRCEATRTARIRRSGCWRGNNDQNTSINDCWLTFQATARLSPAAKEATAA
jgi:hypothetical protein